MAMRDMGVDVHLITISENEPAPFSLSITWLNLNIPLVLLAVRAIVCMWVCLRVSQCLRSDKLAAEARTKRRTLSLSAQTRAPADAIAALTRRTPSALQNQT